MKKCLPLASVTVGRGGGGSSGNSKILLGNRTFHLAQSKKKKTVSHLTLQQLTAGHAQFFFLSTSLRLTKQVLGSFE